MTSERLIESLVCPAPDCMAGQGSRSPLDRVFPHSLRCVRCGRLYAVTPEGYVDVMPPAEGAHTSLYVSREEEFAHKLDYRHIGIPLLGAAVRQRAIRRMLRPTPADRMVELGCGNGKFVFWNRLSVDWAVGVDPAPLFASEALQLVDLVRADARSLPFDDGAFTAALSIDVLEHLPLPDIRAYLAEARRVLSPDGRFFIYSNTREPSRLDFAVRGARRLSAWLGERGVLDNTRDLLRKSDHVKALATYEELEAVLQECGFRVEQAVFWNGLFQSLIENLLVKGAESLLRRLRSGKKAASGAATTMGEDTMRSSMRKRLARRGLAYQGMRALTELMWLDLVLFGKWRAGPYFLLARRTD